MRGIHWLIVGAVITGCGGGGGGGTTQGKSEYSVEIAVTGLTGSGLVVQNSGTDSLTPISNGKFTFPQRLSNGAPYSVTIQTQPLPQTCTVLNGTGVISGVDVTNVSISCSTPNPTTIAIQNNLATNFALEQSNVTSAISACLGKFGISGAALVCGADAKAAAVLVFTDTARSNIETVAASSTIDKVALVNIINQYKEGDLNWPNTGPFAPAVILTPAEIAALNVSYAPKINVYYSNLILAVNAL